jgi:flagellar basal body rod protein FlgC
MQAAAIAAAGITTALASFEASAARTAAAPFDDLAAETVERLEAENAVTANAAVLRTTDDMMGTLLDILV